MEFPARRGHLTPRNGAREPEAKVVPVLFFSGEEVGRGAKGGFELGKWGEQSVNDGEFLWIYMDWCGKHQ